ncbi:SlyX protein [Rodentibacter pneumotropicus]|uniref:SlyX protein n=1 Tax=Rodentibacter pneumotropicus TaxID=758 RepID=UPI000988F75D|nr:SlyX protein [Rodentibacter pneumotropicus]OOF68811.1 SlyX protein [Rodentibacter pneumotropicus]
MSNLKYLPKKVYSISDAVKYISLNHNITISEKDLWEYIQNGDLQASILLDGGLNKVDEINKKEINPLMVRNDEIFLNFSKSACNAKIKFIEDFEIIRIDLNNIYFDITIILNSNFYLEDYFIDNDLIKLFSGELKRFNNVLFSGYFPLPVENFEKYNIEKLISQGFIDEVEKIIINKDEQLYFYLPFEINKNKIYLDDIKIIHEELLHFLDVFTDTSNQLAEINHLKNELIKKDSIITKMQSELIEKRIAKSSTKSENKKNAFIKSLLKIHYGEEVAENPRAHIYDPNLSERSRDGKIQKDFELHGLTKHLPTGKTLKNWVDGVELDN